MFLSVSVLTISCDSEGSGEGEEHSEGGENHEEEGEEPGMKWEITETADETREGLRLILNYDASTTSFIGMVENTNNEIAKQVRVEVHIIDMDGKVIEYGPTTPEDLDSGSMRNISLSTSGESFVQFTMHPEYNK